MLPSEHVLWLLAAHILIVTFPVVSRHVWRLASTSDSTALGQKSRGAILLVVISAQPQFIRCCSFSLTCLYRLYSNNHCPTVSLTLAVFRHFNICPLGASIIVSCDGFHVHFPGCEWCGAALYVFTGCRMLSFMRQAPAHVSPFSVFSFSYVFIEILLQFWRLIL